MPPNYSMKEFSLALVDGIIELHIEGDLSGEFARGPVRAFETITSQIDTRLVLNDIRSASFVLSRQEWEDQMRVIARALKGYRLAYVVRPDQKQVMQGFLDSHGRLGDEAALFKSKADARAWLLGS